MSNIKFAPWKLLSAASMGVAVSQANAEAAITQLKEAGFDSTSATNAFKTLELLKIGIMPDQKYCEAGIFEIKNNKKYLQ